jgi:hypothetical protein
VYQSIYISGVFVCVCVRKASKSGLGRGCEHYSERDIQAE